MNGVKMTRHCRRQHHLKEDILQHH
jgi:hypothetical protein